MRDWLLTATDCSCATLDVCALFEPGDGKSPTTEPGPLHVTQVGGSLTHA
jgi:hypothetical protein